MEEIFVEQIPEKAYVLNVPAMTIFILLHKYRMNHGLIRWLLNRLEIFDSSRCDSYQHEPSRNICDSKLQNFCAQLFQLRKYFCAQHFRKFVAPKIFTYTFHCVIPRQSPIGWVWRPSDQVGYVKSPLNGLVICGCGLPVVASSTSSIKNRGRTKERIWTKYIVG